MNRICPRLAVVFALANALLLTGPGPLGTTSNAETVSDLGETGPQDEGIRVDPHQIPGPSLAGAADRAREIPRRYPVDPSSFGRLKAQANAAAAAGERAGTPSTSRPAPQFPTLSMTQAGGWNPPDAGLAVGPTALVVAVNEAFGVYDRGGRSLLPPKAFNSFFGTTGSTYDPRAVYDAAEGRFVLLATTGAVYTLATSTSSDPTGPWCTYRLPSDRGGATWADFPGLGLDGDTVYVSSNQFSSTTGQFRYAQIVAIPKTSVYANAAGPCPKAASTVFTNLLNPGGGSAFTVQPAHQPDAAPGQTGPMYFVNAIWASGSNFAIRAITRANGRLALGSPEWVARGFIASYDLPADSPQPSGQPIDTGDTRLPSAVFRYGKIYTANTTMHVSSSLSSTANPYANSQWYEITPNALTDSVGASHAVSSLYTAFFFPSIGTGCSAGLTGSMCPTPFVTLQVSGASATQPASAFWVVDGGMPTLYKSGLAGYALNSRWGDYSAVATDPNGASTLWTLGEYARTTGEWGTAVTSVTSGV